MSTRMVTDAVHYYLARRFPGDEFAILDHGPRAGLTIRWVDGPTHDAVRACLPRTAEPVVLGRRWGTEGLGLALRLMQSLLPATRLRTWSGAPATGRGLVIQDARMFHDVLHLPQIPATVGDVLRAVHARIDLTRSPLPPVPAPEPDHVYDWARDSLWGGAPRSEAAFTT